MHIGVDGNEENVEYKVGVSWYVYKLLQQFAKTASAENSYTVFLRENPKRDLPKQNKFFHYAVVPGKIAWSQLFLPFALYIRYRSIDIFFSPAHYTPRFCPVPIVVTLHDLSYFYYPNDFYRRDLLKLEHWTRYSVQHAAKIIAVSDRTKRDALAQYGLRTDAVLVIPNGFEPPSQKPILTSVTSPYFVYVGTLQPRKNIETLLYAFADVHEKYPSYCLRIVGKKGWMYERIFTLVEFLKLTNYVTFTGYVDEKEKYSIITNATALVLPGLYEGFGLPMLEAFYTRVPVVAAYAGALPEIGEDAVLYTKSVDHVDLSLKMIEVIEKKDAEARTKRAYLLVKKYSWERTAHQILDVLKKVYSS